MGHEKVRGKSRADVWEIKQAIGDWDPGSDWAAVIRRHTLAARA